MKRVIISIICGLMAGCAHTPVAEVGIPLRTGLGRVPDSTVPGDVKSPLPSETAGGYRVNAGDRFRLEVFGEQDLSGEFSVLADGTIRHALLGRILVLGMSPEEMELYITELLARDYLVNPKVSVHMEVNRMNQIVVNGQVAKPGVYEFETNVRMTVLTAIARAGGFTDIARESAVRVVRIVEGKETIIPVNVADLLSGKKPDIVLQPDDRVWVPESVF